MAKGILEFNLDNPDDEVAHVRAVKAKDMALAIHRIEQLSFHTREENQENEQLIDFLDSINRVLDQYDINTENLIN